MDLKKKIALDISRSLYRNQNAGYPLRQLFWECTRRCNLACRHCGSDCKVQSGQADMPIEDFLRVLDQVKERTDSHKVSIIITGGEPLMRPDIEQCGLAIYRKGFPWGMVTNGFALTEDRLRGLLKAGIHGLTISLDGIGEDHDWMRGRQGSFDRASAAIRMVCDFNKSCEQGTAALGFGKLRPEDAINFDVVTCVNRRTVGQLDAIKEHLISLGLRRWRLFTIFPVGRAAQDPELQIDREEFVKLMEFIKACRKEGRIHASYACEGFLGDYEGEVRDNFFACNAGISVGSVLIDGSISGCASIRADYHQGNIYRDNFMDVWERGFQPYRNRDWMKKDACGDCRYWRWCLGGGMHLRDSDGKLILCHLDRLR